MTDTMNADMNETVHGDMTDTMKAISQDELGGPEVLKLVTLPTPRPGVSEILIRVHAAAVNPIDAANRETGVFIGKPPFVLGWDISGTVEAVGFGVTIYEPGDEVFGMLPFPKVHGSYAEYVVGPTRAFVRKPEGLDHVTAAAMPMVGLTAWQALVDTAAIDYAGPDFTELVDQQDVVLDVVGDGYAAKALDVLKPGGILVSTQPPSLAAVADRAAERGVRLAGILVEADDAGMLALADLAAAGKVLPTIDATYPLDQAGAAQSAKHGPGKVVLKMV
jgi:NADPH:quinone reductase-like Zn-dependent oxidoreductase